MCAPCAGLQPRIPFDPNGIREPSCAQSGQDLSCRRFKSDISTGAGRNGRSLEREFELLKQPHTRCFLFSSVLVCLPNEKRTAELARSIDRPIASKTCAATTEPTMQADPLDAQTSSKSSAISIVSESKPGKLTLSVFPKQRRSEERR